MSYTREQEQTVLRRLHRMDIRNASAWQSSGCVPPDEPTLEGVLASVIAERDRAVACIEKVRASSCEHDMSFPNEYELGQEDVRDDVRDILAEYDKEASSE